MDKNFIVGQSNELIVEGTMFDLHNDFNLEQVRYDGANLLVELSSVANKQRASLRFDEIKFVLFAKKTNFDNYWGIEEFGYKSPDDFDDDWLLSEQQAKLGDHFFIRFIGDDYLRIYSNRALFEISNKNLSESN
ncbi:MAG: hypothetical protein ABJK37_01315 [Paraglaciecola sp.]|uniref:hypothetical protein n=1 Tax=Paraglaciecola sp. TaxID=1920173 RepID=UPI00329889FA